MVITRQYGRYPDGWFRSPLKDGFLSTEKAESNTISYYNVKLTFFQYGYR